ncbi:hypothetical protein BDM02DRAFT_2083463 [Thelephora ganbajun]|uniref:Uncharacterized protein n=1 Tax=Thelephora ganbajun TaxID=370292 RepID=A0ACB6ZH49_THEGA|nr:hypothetical protein BDM02DRAFT_2083463 [Thelephora ganbajun]
MSTAAPQFDAYVLPPHYRNKRCTILVTGASSSAKTAFINAATQSDELQAESSSAESSAEPLRSSNSFELDSGHIVTLLDVSLSKSKSAELQEFFNTQYQNGDLTTGIIFLHSLADDDSAGKTTPFRALKELCGEQALRNTVIATTDWVTEPPEARKKQERWEKKLSNTLFASAIAEGARVFRHKENTTAATRKIVKALLGRPPILVGVQKRLADDALRLQRTESGGIFLGDISVEDGNTVQPEMQAQEHGVQGRSEGTTMGVSQRSLIASRSSKTEQNGYVTGARHKKTLDHKQKLKRWKQRQEHRARKVVWEKWDPVEMVACVCCGAALYAVLTLFREHGAYVIGL